MAVVGSRQDRKYIYITLHFIFLRLFSKEIYIKVSHFISSIWLNLYAYIRNSFTDNIDSPFCFALLCEPRLVCTNFKNRFHRIWRTESIFSRYKLRRVMFKNIFLRSTQCHLSFVDFIKLRFRTTIKFFCNLISGKFWYGNEIIKSSL